MDRGKNEMTCLCSRQRRLDRLRGTHLTDQDHIRIFPERRVESLLIILHIGADLPLVDDRALRRVDIFDGILQRNNMKRPLPVDLLQDRCQRRGFSASGLPGHKNDPFIPP